MTAEQRPPREPRPVTWASRLLIRLRLARPVSGSVTASSRFSCCAYICRATTSTVRTIAPTIMPPSG